MRINFLKSKVGQSGEVHDLHRDFPQDAPDRSADVSRLVYSKLQPVMKKVGGATCHLAVNNGINRLSARFRRALIGNGAD
jgi:hypothetical protein